MATATQVIATIGASGHSHINVRFSTRTYPGDIWIGSRVRIKRNSREITENEFSNLLGINLNELATFETGAERTNANLLFRIAKSLDVQPNYFFQGYVEERSDAI
jgi:hypothetical protein